MRKAFQEKLEMADIHQRAGQINEAIALCNAVLQEDSANVAALNVKATALHRASHFAEAEILFTQALSLDSNSLDARYGLVLCAASMGNSAKGEKEAKALLEKKPDHLQALLYLGQLYQAHKRYEESIRIYQQAIKHHPNMPELYSRMGKAFHQFQQFEQAEKVCRIALKLNPDHVQSLYNLIDIYADLKMPAESEAAGRKAIELSPDLLPAYDALSNMFKYYGKFSEAQEILQKGIERFPEDGGLHYNLIYTKGFEADDAFIQKLVKSYGAAKQDKDKIAFAFGLARLYEARKDYETAFRYYAEGNALHEKNFPFDIEGFESWIDSIKENFDAEWKENIDGYGNEELTPIFIVGLPRCGSTLVEQVLDSHSQVAGGGEMRVIPDIGELATFNLTGKPYPLSAKLLKAEGIKQLADYYLSFIRQMGIASTPHPTDKMLGNYCYVGLIHLLFPKAKVIFCTRNPMDHCLSMYQQCFYGKHPYGYNLTTLGRVYKKHMEMMEHWKSLLPGMIIEVPYEEMVADTEGMAKRIVAFCGMEWEEACLEFYRNTRAIRTASVLQVRQPVYNNAVDKWRVYEKFLAPLQESLKN